MILIDLVFALLVALFFTVLLAAPLGWRHPARADSAWSAGLFLFFLLLVGVWAIGSWSSPVGPTLLGGYWLPFLIAGFVIALVIASAAPADRRRGGGAPRPDLAGEPPEPSTALAITLFGAFFWLALIGLVALAVASYFFKAL